MNLPAFLFLVLICVTACKNNSIDCDSNLDKVPYLARHGLDLTDKSKDSLLKDMSILSNCGQLDSIDLQLIHPVIVMSLANSFRTGKQITYRSLLNDFIAEMKLVDYQKIHDYYASKLKDLK